MPIKAIIFDYFGVVSTDGYWSIGGEDVKNTDPNDKFHQLSDKVNTGELSWEEFINNVSDVSGRSVQEVIDTYDANRLDAQLLELIATLKQSYKTALLTNANGGYIRPIIEELSLDKFFEHVYVSSEVGLLKPDPRMYEYALSDLGVEPGEAIMVDDQIRNIDGAKAVGMHAILFDDSQSFSKDLKQMLEAEA